MFKIFESKYPSNWKYGVETDTRIEHFKTKEELNEFIRAKKCSVSVSASKDGRRAHRRSRPRRK